MRPTFQENFKNRNRFLFLSFVDLMYGDKMKRWMNIVLNHKEKKYNHKNLQNDFLTQIYANKLPHSVSLNDFTHLIVHQTRTHMRINNSIS